jgi:hypothetical protein
MSELLSPFATLHPWLAEAIHLECVRFVRDLGSRSHRCPVYEGLHLEGWQIDLRHFATRSVVVRAIADHGFSSIGWAAGRPWSKLTDEQAGRVVAEIVRRIGSDPKTAAHLPRGVLALPHDSITDRSGWWLRHRTVIAGEGAACSWFRDDCNGRQKNGWRFEIYKTPYSAEKIDLSGPDFGNDGQRLSEKAAQMHGYLLVEQITPPEKS